MQKGQQIGQGRTADVYVWGNDRILKLYQSWIPQVAVEQEYTISQAAQAAGVPVPSTEELVEVDGRFGIVFERIQGPSLLKSLESSPWTMREVAHQMAELHVKINACIMLPEIPSQRKQIEDGIAAARGWSDAKKETARQCLANLPEGDALCHGDFHPDNILVSDHGPVVIDWMTGSRGDPVGDVARTSIIFHTGGLPPRMSWYMRVVLNASRSILYNLYIKQYLQLRPTKRAQINVWELPLTAARLCEVEDYPIEKAILLKRLDILLSRQRGNTSHAL